MLELPVPQSLAYTAHFDNPDLTLCQQLCYAGAWELAAQG
jgi:hypothetical protein